MKNKFIYINYKKNKSSYNLKFNKNTNFTIIIVLDQDKNLNINIHQFNNNTNFKCNVLLIGYNNSNLKVNINAVNFANNQNTLINVYALAYNTNIGINIENIVNNTYNECNVKQTIKGLLLSSNAKIYTLPNLNLNTNNVVAEHKVNISGLDKDEIYYLNTKGINDKDANNLIINSYINNVLYNLPKFKQNKYLNIINKVRGNNDW